MVSCRTKLKSVINWAIGRVENDSQDKSRRESNRGRPLRRAYSESNNQGGDGYGSYSDRRRHFRESSPPPNTRFYIRSEGVMGVCLSTADRRSARKSASNSRHRTPHGKHRHHRSGRALSRDSGYPAYDPLAIDFRAKIGKPPEPSKHKGQLEEQLPIEQRAQQHVRGDQNGRDEDRLKRAASNRKRNESTKRRIVVKPVENEVLKEHEKKQKVPERAASNRKLGEYHQKAKGERRLREEEKMANKPESARSSEQPVPRRDSRVSEGKDTERHNIQRVASSKVRNRSQCRPRRKESVSQQDESQRPKATGARLTVENIKAQQGGFIGINGAETELERGIGNMDRTYLEGMVPAQNNSTTVLGPANNDNSKNIARFTLPTQLHRGLGNMDRTMIGGMVPVERNGLPAVARRDSQRRLAEGEATMMRYARPGGPDIRKVRKC